MWLILAIVALFGMGASGLTNFLGQTVPGQVTSSACYALEEGKKIIVDPIWLIKQDCQTLIAGRTFVGIRPNVRIVNAKINEGKGAHPDNDCSQSYYGSLRKIGRLPTGEEIYWESENHKHDDLTDFLLININRDSKYHYFDVYVDERKKSDLPDFIVNCKETGGLVPVVEEPNASVFPPQFIHRSQIDHPQPDHDANFNDPTINPYLTDNFVRMSESSLPQPTPGQPPPQIGVFTKTVASESHTYDVFFHAGILYLKDQLTLKTYLYNPSDSDEAPDYDQQTNRSLQLKVQKFISTAEWTWATPECKPALYLYPEKKTELSIKVQPRGKLTTSVPEHSQDGWQVIAYPDGTIKLPASRFQLPASYPYLYYESAIEDFTPPGQGWVVAQNELAALFDRILPLLGLNQKETADFKEYWLEVLTQAPYYFVGLVPKAEIDKIEPIYFSQSPDTFIRIRLFFEPLNQPATVSEVQLPSPLSRRGFTAVDWGGMLAKGSCSPNGETEVVSR